ncbi:MAG: hypothetical protein P8Y71_18185 [Pseudolabrys sp.]
MRLAYVTLAAFGVILLSAGASNAETCRVDNCSISCAHGCAAVVVGGKCRRACADKDGNLPASWWHQLDSTRKASKGISEILCFKGIKNTRGLSGNSCK